jgi:hypothetical protein
MLCPRLALALGLLLSAPTLATPIEISHARIEESSPSPGQLFSPIDDLFDIKICKEQRVQEKCRISVRTAGFEATDFVVAVIDPTTARIRIAGQAPLKNGSWSGNLSFTEIGPIKLLFMLTKRLLPIAVEGIAITVHPPRDQFGEQDRRSIFDQVTSEGESGETYYYYSPPND